MSPLQRRPRFEPLRSATPPCGAQNADQSMRQMVSFSMSPPVPFRMSLDTACALFRGRSYQHGRSADRVSEGHDLVKSANFLSDPVGTQQIANPPAGPDDPE